MTATYREFEGRPVSSLYAEIERLTAEIERLRDALDFYADPGRWMKRNGIDDERIPDFYDELCFGERALIALNAVQQSERQTCAECDCGDDPCNWVKPAI